jgi:hypothetical protein
MADLAHISLPDGFRAEPAENRPGFAAIIGTVVELGHALKVGLGQTGRENSQATEFNG